ncbi:MAG TPA: 5'-nucleotidase [Acidobacteriaceae bacterium]
MGVDLSECFVVGISSRALFDLTGENDIFETEGLAAYTNYQIAHELDILQPGTGFQLVEGLLNLNTQTKLAQKIVVVVMSKNNAETSIRISKSIQHYNLDIIRGAYTSGAPLAPYLGAFSVDLFLSASKADVQAASNAGFAAGLIYPYHQDDSVPVDGLRIAFDGDAVIFSDESEQVYKAQGIEKFLAHEKEKAALPLPDGPFANLLRKLADIQSQSEPLNKSLVRTALITARNAPADERVIRTLRDWGVRIDEVFFMGGASKAPVLKAFAPHIFFDDQEAHCAPASEVVPTAQVLISTRPKQQKLDFEDPAPAARKPAASVPAIVVPFRGDVAAFEIKQAN